MACVYFWKMKMHAGKTGLLALKNGDPAMVTLQGSYPQISLINKT